MSSFLQTAQRAVSRWDTTSKYQTKMVLKKSN